MAKTAQIELRSGRVYLSPWQKVCLKLSLPDDPALYDGFVNHPHVMRLLALSGGYSRAEAVQCLARCDGMSASFSRALTEGQRLTLVHFSAQRKRFL